MFKSLKQVTYQVIDLGRARQWYCDILRTRPVFETSAVSTFKVGDCWLTLSKASESLHASSERIFCFWEVDDIDIAYRCLIDAGATPHLPIMQVANFAFARVIDPFGNILGITHAMTNARDQSVDNKPSQTAMITAFCRALAANDDRLTPRGPDTLAHFFLPNNMRKHAGDVKVHNDATGNFLPPWLYGYVTARTAFFDDHFREALSKSISQIVFLGAGYDTRPYRFRDILRNTRIFELDIELTQQRKRTILNGAGIEIPPQVSYVSIDFKVDTIHHALKKSGFDDSKETLFIWEGVIYYLSPEAVGSTLNQIREHTTRGSTFCLDYMTEKIDSPNPGEPCRFWIAPDEIELFLAKYGIEITEHVDSNEMERRYLTLADGLLAEKLLPNFRFVHGILLD
ncbi:MAG: SAM-dependent methyltransferase [Chitinivibrionales bacterium]|nr:SAM-dependent methyltransferase [Chitinivibrionales bacterium]